MLNVKVKVKTTSFSSIWNNHKWKLVNILKFWKDKNETKKLCENDDEVGTLNEMIKFFDRIPKCEIFHFLILFCVVQFLFSFLYHHHYHKHCEYLHIENSQFFFSQFFSFFSLYLLEDDKILLCLGSTFVQWLKSMKFIRKLER